MCFLHKEKEPLSREAYDKLVSWLRLHAEDYQNVCDRLVVFFETNHCFHPDECATETIDIAAKNRAADRISASDPPFPFCIGIARNVRNEYHRCKLNPLPLPDPSRVLAPDSTSEETPEQQGENVNQNENFEERKEACKKKCLQKLKPEQHDLVITYKKQKGKLKKAARALMALALGISPNALRQRVKIIVKRLRKCYQACLKTA